MTEGVGFLDQIRRMHFRRRVCDECPWRKDTPVGAFSVEAFQRTANTAYDMADRAFACHKTEGKGQAACAGFLLQGARHNMLVRIAISLGRYDPATLVRDSLPELFDNFREMAEANGVAPDDPALARCRSADEPDLWSEKGRRRTVPPP